MFRQSLPNCGITQTDTFGQPSWKKCRPFARHLDEWDPLPWWALPHSLKDEPSLTRVWAQHHRRWDNPHQVWARPHLVWPHPHMRQPSFLVIFSRDFGWWWHHPHMSLPSSGMSPTSYDMRVFFVQRNGVLSCQCQGLEDIVFIIFGWFQTEWMRGSGEGFKMWNCQADFKT